MNTFAEWFFTEFARVTSNRIDKEDRCAVYDVSVFLLEHNVLKAKRNFISG